MGIGKEKMQKKDILALRGEMQRNAPTNAEEMTLLAWSWTCRRPGAVERGRSRTIWGGVLGGQLISRKLFFLSASWRTLRRRTISCSSSALRRASEAFFSAKATRARRWSTDSRNATSEARSRGAKHRVHLIVRFLGTNDNLKGKKWRGSSRAEKI